MSLKYKIIFIVLLCVFLLIVPASWYFMDKREKDQISAIIQQQRIISSMIAQSTLNILLMNGGDITTSAVDIKEMLSFLKPFFSDGLIYADAILLSSDEKNGTILASLSSGESPSFLISWNRRTDDNTLSKLRKTAGSHWEYIDPSGESYLVFSALGALPNKPPFCIGRLVFSKSVVLEPVRASQKVLSIGLLFLIFFIIIIGYIFTSFLSRRINTIISGVKMIEAGNLSGSVSVESHDELGVLAVAFNNMARKLEQKISELQNSNEALSRMDRLKDEFLANTSHELRTPINGIVGIAESLLEGAGGELTEKMSKNLDMIASSGRRLGSLVNDILDFSRLKNRDLELRFNAVDMRIVTQLVVSITRSLAERKKIAIRNLITQDCPLVLGDEDRLQQILLNLIGNAIKYSEKGEVAVSAEPVTHNGQDYLEVSILDTGIGIPEAIMERLFQSFEQGDGSVSRSQGGTGLGLAITRKLVELHGGEIHVKSQVGAGSCFSFTIPVCTDAEHVNRRRSTDLVEQPADFRMNHLIDREGISPVEFRKSGTGRILIVDDESVNLQVLINHLGIEGFDVLIATSGHEALNIIEERGAPDLILLDVMMPQMSGFEVCQIIRKKYSLHELPIVMVTARKRTEDIISGIEAGANDYIVKPFDRQELLARVNNLLMLKRAVREQQELSILEKEMETARTIQMSILPENLPALTGLDIQVGYRPMRAVGGDFYDFFIIDDKRVGVFIADVSGHGTPAAIISSMLKVVFTLSAHTAEDPSLLLESLNTSLCGYSHGHFISALYAIVDIEKMLLTVANSGHWPLLICRSGQNSLTEVGKPGRVIGIFEELCVETQSVPMQAGDRLVFFTDGILEHRDRSGRFYGEDGLHDLIRSCQKLDANGLIDTLFKSLNAWSGSEQGDVLEDDATVIVVDLGV